jgi:hypothetical protein
MALDPGSVSATLRKLNENVFVFAEQSILVVDLLSSDDEQASEEETEELGDFLLQPADASEVGNIHGLINSKDSKTKCCLYWCLIE